MVKTSGRARALPLVSRRVVVAQPADSQQNAGIRLSEHVEGLMGASSASPSSPTSGQQTSPVMSALFMSGAFTMFSAIVFYSPFAISPYAQQNDVYMGNLFIAPVVFLLGSVAFLIGQTGLGLRAILAALLALVTLLAIGVFAFGNLALPIPFYAAIMMAGTLLLLIVGCLVTSIHGMLKLWSRGMVVAFLGTGALALLYILFGGHYTSLGDQPVNWPPYLTAPILGGAVAIAGAIFLIGWLWGQTAAR